MAKYVLPIKSTYVPDWGVWECIREIIQNAKDEEDQNGNAMVVTFKDGWLSVKNAGASMDKQALLLGQTSKSSRADLRGQFGEGLNLALLVGAREGLDMEIFVNDEKWSPTIEKAEAFGHAECLVIHTRKLKAERNGVEVMIKIGDAWESLKELFLFLKPPTTTAKVDNGTVILDAEYKGRIYVKGIFVTKIKDFEFGYDFKYAKLDRDRRMIDMWDLKWESSRMLMQALATSPTTFMPKAMKLLDEGSDEISNIVHHVHKGSDVMKSVVSTFHEKHGENALPVRTMAQSQELEHYGKKGVVVSEAMGKLLEVEFGAMDEVQKELRKAVRERYSWGDLHESEKDNLTRACDLVDRALGYTNRSTLTQLQVVAFNDQDLQGLCELGSSEILISRERLSEFSYALQTIVHEKAHAESSAADGEKSHVSKLEDIWSEIVKLLTN